MTDPKSETSEAINSDHPRDRVSLRTSNRPGDEAARYAEENGVSYESALVSCNMD